MLQAVTTHGYDEFVARVAAGRKKTTAEVDTIAQGRVWAGWTRSASGSSISSARSTMR